MLIGEQYFVVVSTHTFTSTTGGVRTVTTYSYHYNDIIVVNISAAGQIEWTEKVAKRQRTKNDGGFYSSYVTTVSKDKLYFIFNDNADNLTYTGKEKLSTFRKEKKAIITVVEVDEKGKQTRKRLLTKKEAGILARPKVSKQVSSNEVIIAGESKKSQRLAKITFK